MPVVEISKKDLERLVKRKLPIAKLKELLTCVKGELETVQGDTLKIEIKDINRPDLWSTAGIARELKGELGVERGLPKFKVNKVKSSRYKVIVSPTLKKIRPLTVCAVVKNLKLNNAGIRQLIQIQEKLCDNFGRGRKEVALGIYDADKITWPVYYKAVRPDGVKFIPLEFNRELTPKQILRQHPQGRKYGKLLEGKKLYPLFIDAADEILSIPPIINSQRTGKITEQTKNAFIEVSGFSFRFLVPALLVMVTALSERGCQIETVSVKYGKKRLVTPNLKPKKAMLDTDYCNNLLGISLKAPEIAKLLSKRRIQAKVRGKRIEVAYPAYRQDIMHANDLCEEVAISYGYNRFRPEVPELATVGQSIRIESFSRKVATLLTGLNMQEVATFTLTNKEQLFKKMNLPEQPVIEIKNPISSNYICLRNWVLPSLLAFLARNKKAAFPQAIFEIGNCTPKNLKDITRVAVVVTHAKTNFTQAKQTLDYLLLNLGLSGSIKETEHPSFIPGRVGRVTVKGKKVAYIGEIHPAVLEKWGLKMPVAAFELNLSELMSLV